MLSSFDQFYNPTSQSAHHLFNLPTTSPRHPRIFLWRIDQRLRGFHAFDFVLDERELAFVHFFLQHQARLAFGGTPNRSGREAMAQRIGQLFLDHDEMVLVGLYVAKFVLTNLVKGTVVFTIFFRHINGHRA